jgi:hypothetical protein
MNTLGIQLPAGFREVEPYDRHSDEICVLIAAPMTDEDARLTRDRFLLLNQLMPCGTPVRWCFTLDGLEPMLGRDADGSDVDEMWVITLKDIRESPFEPFWVIDLSNQKDRDAETAWEWLCSYAGRRISTLAKWDDSIH